MGLLISEFLSQGGTLEELEIKYGIKHRVHPQFPNLVLLKYNQIDSPMGEEIVQECRGIILDSENGFNPVSWPFSKFFNYGEGHAKPIDWATAKVQEKLDGTLCTLWWYAGEWHVATTGTPDAGGQVEDLDISFKDLFWEVFFQCGYTLPGEEWHDYSFMFELTTEHNRIVVVHQEPSVRLLAVRNRIDGMEVDPYKFESQYNVVQCYPLGSIPEILGTFSSMDPLQHEGYVVVDGNFNRVKVKHPGYVAIHHLKENATPKNFLKIILSGEHSEFLTYFPEFTSEFNWVRGAYDDLVNHLESEYSRLRDIQGQREFAFEALKTRHSATLFNLRRGSVGSVRESLARVTIDSLMKVLGLKESEPQVVAD